MKIKTISDLHTEFGAYPYHYSGEDIVIFAGDIGVYTDGVKAAKVVAAAHQIPALVIAGNHEFYRNDTHPYHTWENTIDALKREADHTSKVVKGEVTFLENSTVLYEGVRFIGATLWTDMCLFGENPLVRIAVRDGLNDYEDIRNEFGYRILPSDTLSRHGESRAYIEGQLREVYDGPTVVITHHAPSSLSIAEKYRHEITSAAYASRLENLILDTEPTLWVHGHTHNNFNYVLGKTQVVCNPRGYIGLHTNLEFDPTLLVEIYGTTNQDVEPGETDLPDSEIGQESEGTRNDS